MSENPAIHPRKIAIVPTPITATGAVSAGDLEKYVRWLRRTAIDGVLLWTEVGAGADLDLAEREELYTVWRGGLLPHQQVWVQVPAGGHTVSADEIRFQAAHARELGADGIVLSPGADKAELVNLDSSDFQVIDADKAQDALGIAWSLVAAVDGRGTREANLRDMDAQQVALLLLHVLAERKVISKAGSFTLDGTVALDLSHSTVAVIYNDLVAKED